MLKASRKTTKTALKEIKNSAFTCGYTVCTAESTMLRDFKGKKKRVTVCKLLSLDLGKNFKFCPSFEKKLLYVTFNLDSFAYSYTALYPATLQASCCCLPSSFSMITFDSNPSFNRGVAREGDSIFRATSLQYLYMTKQLLVIWTPHPPTPLLSPSLLKCWLRPCSTI